MSSAAPLPLLRRAADRVLRTSWLHPLNDVDALNDLLGWVDPRWSLTEIRAELVRREPETDEVCSFWLRPNGLWPGFAGGQHLSVQIEIDGVRQQRFYSLSSDPAEARLLRLTVKRHDGGRVSRWLHERLQPGDVITLGAPSGDFVLPAHLEHPLLLIGAGSGMTPLLSLLYALRARAPQADVVLMQVCRNPADELFAGELHALARDWPGLRVQAWHTAQRGRPEAATLLAGIADAAAREAYVCGPAPFMAAIEAQRQALGASAPLHLERFGLPPRAPVDGAAADVRCARSERAFAAAPGEPLLVAAEGAGLRPAYGCRIGICHTCLCHKRSGSVENLVSGERSDGDEWIRLCVSAARSDLELDL